MIDKYIEQYGRRLYGLCVTLCKNKYDAEDLYQDTWLKVVKYIDKYNNEYDFEPWLARICVNTYKNTLRRFINSPIFNGFKNEQEKENIINKIAQKQDEDYSDLHKAIDKLPEKFRIVVILFYFEGMDIKMTSKVIGIPEGTVKSRLSKARSMLKESLKYETNLQF